MDDTQEESLFEAPPIAEQERMVEAILFAAAEPVSLREMAGRMPHGCDPVQAVQNIQKRYEGRGVAVVKVQESWAIRTAPDLGFLMQREIRGIPKTIARRDRNFGHCCLSSAGDPRGN